VLAFFGNASLLGLKLALEVGFPFKFVKGISVGAGIGLTTGISIGATIGSIVLIPTGYIIYKSIWDRSDQIKVVQEKIANAIDE
jgi:hypothetical protein